MGVPKVSIIYQRTTGAVVRESGLVADYSERYAAALPL